MPFRNSSESCKILLWQEAQETLVLGDGDLVRGAGNVGEEGVN